MADDIVTRLRKLVATDNSRHLKDGAMLLAADEIERLRAVVADRDEWNDSLANDISDLLMAIPKPFRKWAYLRSQRVKEARRG